MGQIGKIDMCNQALQRIGVRDRIASLTEDSPEAIECNLVFDTVRDKTMRRHDWPFARKRADLNEDATVTLPDNFAWAYVYTYPSDCLKMRLIDDALQKRLPEQSIPFMIERHPTADRRIIYTDQNEACAIYTRRVKDVDDWPADFVEALVWQIAAEIAWPLTGDRKLGIDLWAAADQARRMAYASALNEQELGVEPESGLIAARTGNPAAEISALRFDPNQGV